MSGNHRPQAIPSAFIWRRLHSLMGLLLVVFLIEHLLTNSEAALFVGEDGAGFVRMVNFIHSLPYLPAIEIALIGIPMFVHLVWGIKYLLTAKTNSFYNDGSSPALAKYARNHWYTLQRLTSWLLVVGVIAHVVHMRFGSYPGEAHLDGEAKHLVQLNLDDGLYTVAERLGVLLFDQAAIDAEAQTLAVMDLPDVPATAPASTGLDADRAQVLLARQAHEQKSEWVEALRAKPINDGQVVAATPNSGTAWLLVVRDTFKMPVMIGLYSVFVLAACFHAFNGLWTFFITWGLTVTERSQKLARYFCVALMGGVAFLGLISIWGTYWLNLYH